MSYEVFVCEEIGKYETFEEAFKVFYKCVKHMVEGGVAWQVLESYCWMKSSGPGLPLMWYDARDEAYDMGLMTDGQLTEEYELGQKELEVLSRADLMLLQDSANVVKTEDNRLQNVCKMSLLLERT